MNHRVAHRLVSAATWRPESPVREVRPMQSARPARPSWWWPVRPARPVFALLVALALVLQLAIAERHFHTLFEPLPAGASATIANGDDSVPLSPLTGPQDDDCAQCQLLALGTATDVPHESIGWPREAHGATPVPADHASLRQHARGSHQARAPPSPLAIA
jgi:hypothetical protein